MFVLNCTKWRPAKRGNSSGKIHRRGIQENTGRIQIDGYNVTQIVRKETNIL